MATRDYSAIAAWCADAHSVLSRDLPPELAEMRVATINRWSGKAPIVEVASDLAEGISHLPENRRREANMLLVAKHGFGFEYFTRPGHKRLLKIIARGAIRTEAEHRAAADALSDTTLEPDMLSALEALVLERERQLGAT